MSAVSQYLKSDNLHYKPLSARLGRAVLWTSTSLQKKKPTSSCLQFTVTLVAKGIILGGALALIPLAAVEAASSLAIGTLGMVLNRSLWKNRSEFLQKFSLKFIAYGINSLVVVVALFALGLSNPNLRFHTVNAAADHAIHIGSAAFAISFLDRSPSSERLVNLLHDSHPTLLEDLLDQLQSDFGLDLRGRVTENPTLTDYLRRHPEDRNFIQSFDFRRLSREVNYRRETLELLRRFLVDIRLIRAGQPLANMNALELNQNNSDEGNYQDRLGALLKHSFLEIYRSAELSQYLSKDQLANMQGEIFVPLSSYTQYKELLGEIGCPPRFSRHLERYNSRQRDLIAAKRQLDTLTTDQKSALVRKILCGSSFAVTGKVQEVYLKVSELANPLYRGPLMKKHTLNLGTLGQGNFGQVFETQDLVQKACQEALAEINAD
jgi:hypothetical protein